MGRALESIRKKNPFTLYGTMLLLLLAVFVGCMTYCAHIILSDEAPEVGHVPWSKDRGQASDTEQLIIRGTAVMPKGGH
jgi:hypothetical protein